MIDTLFMEYPKHIQKISKEYDVIIIKHQANRFRAFILASFWALEPIQ